MRVSPSSASASGQRVRPPALRRIGLALAALGLFACGIAQAQSAPPPATAAATVPKPSRPVNSALDAQTFYQLFIAELELRRGDASLAYQVLIDTGRRLRDEAVFRRAVDVAIGARASEQALAGLKTWRQTLPRSRDAALMQSQVLMALGRPGEAVEPMRSAIELTPADERANAIEALATLVLRGEQATAAAKAIDDALKPWAEASPTRAATLVASARAWLVAGDKDKALQLAQQAQALEPMLDAPALIGLELFGQDPLAETLAATYVRQPKAAAALRLIYARRLTAAQRYREAQDVTSELVAYQPDFAPAWLMRGALQLELGTPEAARQSLVRYLEIKDADARKDDSEDDEDEERAEAHAAADAQERNQALLMLAQASEALKDFQGAQGWLERMVDTPDSSNVTLRRASLLARTGKLEEARGLIRGLPERNAEDRRAKIMAETQLLRDQRQWNAAYEVLVTANQAQPDDPDLLYEQALLAEKLLRHDEMERLLRRVITIKPDQQHAYNALGYSLADRGLRLEEARGLIAKALELAPDDPFITDSLGWVEFRLGRGEAALALLRKAYEQRPDVEIGAHLGEVLWSLGRRQEALDIWRAGQQRDAGNEVLAETLARLKVRL